MSNKTRNLKTYNKHNFHNSTFCIWREVFYDQIKGLKISYKSKSGSQYIFNEAGVYRISNHWGRAANCRWRLLPLSDFKNQNTTIGFAKWSDFYPNDDVSKLYYVLVNFDERVVDIFHKDSNDYDGKAVLRSGSATSKIIQNIKIILNETSWAKHLIYDDYEELQRKIISELIYTDKSFVEIKRKFV